MINLEEYKLYYLKVMLEYIPEETWQNHETSQSGRQGSGTETKPRIPLIQNNSATKSS
jgi:hypothetical protein